MRSRKRAVELDSNQVVPPFAMPHGRRKGVEKYRLTRRIYRFSSICIALVRSPR